MKTLILTFVLVFVSFFSNSQIKYDLYYGINSNSSSIDKNDSTIVWSDRSDIKEITINQEMFLYMDSIDGHIISNYSIRYKNGGVISNMSNIQLNQINQFIQNVNILINDTTFLLKISCVDLTTFDVYLKIQQTGVGLSENSLSDISLKVYPNPTVDYVTVSFDSKDVKNEINVYSLSGQLMYSDVEFRNIGENEVKINMSDFPTGMYLVKVQDKTFKVNKQ